MIKKIKAQSPDPYLGKIKGDTELARLAHLNNIVDQINSGAQSTTYLELNALITTSKLIPGNFYMISDYQTVYDQPDYDVYGIPKTVVSTLTGPVEPLMVLAVSPNGIAEQVWSTIHPGDHILYDITFVATEVMGAPAKGRIIQRTNEERNVAGYDHRTVVLKRYESAPASGIFNQVKDNGGASVNLPTFGIGCETINISYIRETEPGFDDPIFLVSNNVFGEYCEEIYCGQDFYNNTIGDLCYGVSFNHWCHDNIIGTGFINNHIGNEFSFNIIGNAFSENKIGNTFQNNTIQDSFISNSIGNAFGRDGANSIGSGFFSNTVEDMFGGNDIADQFMHNYIDDSFTNCSVDMNFQNNDVNVAVDGTANPILFTGTKAHDTSYCQIVNAFTVGGIADGQLWLVWLDIGTGTYASTGL